MNLSHATNTVPDVPREILQSFSKTVPVPAAAAALSPAPTATLTSVQPNLSAISFFKVPATE